MKAVVASIIEKIEIEVVEEKEREIEFITILRMKDGLLVKVKKRERKCQ